MNDPMPPPRTRTLTEYEAPPHGTSVAREPRVEIGVALDEDRAALGGSIRPLHRSLIS